VVLESDECKLTERYLYSSNIGLRHLKQILEEMVFSMLIGKMQLLFNMNPSILDSISL